MEGTREVLQTLGIEEIASTWVGWDPTLRRLPAIPAAIVLYTAIYLIGLTLINVCKLLPQPLRSYTMDFTLTMTLCSYPFGHGIMRKYYGEVGFLLAVIPLITFTFATFPAADGNPIDVWLKYFRKQMTFQRCLFKSVLQIFAGLAAYRLGMLILNLELHPMYVERLQEYYKSFCVTDLNVPIYVGFLIEFFAVVYESLFSSIPLLKNARLDGLIKTINAVLLVSAGVHLTGMYMHPAMATGHTFGCGNTPRTAHILIYWVGPMIGAWLSVQIRNRVGSISAKGGNKGKPKTKPVQFANKVEYADIKAKPNTKPVQFANKGEYADINGNNNTGNKTAKKGRRKFYN